MTGKQHSALAFADQAQCAAYATHHSCDHVNGHSGKEEQLRHHIPPEVQPQRCATNIPSCLGSPMLWHRRQAYRSGSAGTKLWHPRNVRHVLRMRQCCDACCCTCTCMLLAACASLPCAWRSECMCLSSLWYACRRRHAEACVRHAAVEDDAAGAALVVMIACIRRAAIAGRLETVDARH